jgi:adenylate cyclase
MRWSRVLPGILVGIVTTAALIAIRIADPITLATMRGAGFDTMQRIWPRQNTNPSQIRIIDIDESSLQKLGQWPWPRNDLAKMVDQLNSLGAATIVFDIVFPERDRMSPDLVLNDATNKHIILQPVDAKTLPNNDEIFAKAIAKTQVITAFAKAINGVAAPPLAKAGFAQVNLSALGAPPQLQNTVQNLSILDQAAAGIGGINIDLRQEQGIARQIPMLWSDGKNYYPSLTLEALRVVQGESTYIVNGSASTEDTIDSIRIGAIEIPVSESGQFTVYYGRNDPNLYVSAAKLFDSDNLRNIRPLITDHIVLIGTSAAGLVDSRTSSLGQSIPGVSVHAQALQQILSKKFLQRPEWIVASEYYFVGLLGLLIAFFTALIRPLPLVIGLIGSLASLTFGATYAFNQLGLLVDVTFPILALATTFLSTIAFRLLVTEREGRQLRNVFSHYVAPTILAEIESNPTALKLGGETRVITVMFVDIENFTPMCEALQPEVLVKVVNTLLSACSQPILKNGGTIDKYIGDATMALWNAPLPQNDHQYMACLAALDIQAEIASFNDDEPNQALLKPFGLWPVSVRIGLATGPAIVGNMGSLERFDYSALGETVNIASRAEGICKHIGHNIIVAGELDPETKSLAIIDGGQVMIRGKSLKTTAHILIGDKVTAASEDFQSFLNCYKSIIADLNAKQAASQIRQAIKKYPLQAKFLQKLEARRYDYQKNLKP